MNDRDRGWLGIVALVLLALFVHDWLRGRAGQGTGERLRVSRWQNIPTPPDEVSVSSGLSPGARGTVPAVDGGTGRECGCS